MRRAIGLTLAGLGAFLLVIAVLLRTYVPGQVMKYPLNEYLVTQLVGHGTDYFSPSQVQPITGATMVVTSTVKGDAGQGSSSTAVWDSFTYLYDETNHARYSYSIRRFAFDRRTAELITCCGANVDGDSSIRQTGLVGFLWPFGTQPHTYQVFDPAMNKAAPARYMGTTTIDGITVYRFVEKVTGARIGTQTVPRSLVGMTGSSTVTLPETYTATNTYFVDPDTGAQLNEIQDEHLALTDASGTQRLLLLLNTSLSFTPQSLAKVVSLDQSARREIAWLTMIVPLIAGVLGIAGLVGGILLARPRRDDQPDHEDAAVSAPVPDPDPAI
jgi:hypothetical protein